MWSYFTEGPTEDFHQRNLSLLFFLIIYCNITEDDVKCSTLPWWMMFYDPPTPSSHKSTTSRMRNLGASQTPHLSTNNRSLPQALDCVSGHHNKKRLGDVWVGGWLATFWESHTSLGIHNRVKGTLTINRSLINSAERASWGQMICRWIWQVGF